MLYVAPQQGKLASLVVDITTLRFLESRNEVAAKYMRDLVYSGRQRANATICSSPTRTMRKDGEDIGVVEDSAEIEISLREAPASRFSVPARLLELSIFAQ